MPCYTVDSLSSVSQIKRFRPEEVGHTLHGGGFQTRFQRLRGRLQLFCQLLNSISTSSHCLGFSSVALFRAHACILEDAALTKGPHCKISHCHKATMPSCSFLRDCLEENKKRFARTKANLKMGCLLMMPYLVLVVSVK